MANLEGSFAKLGTTGANQQIDFLKALGPGFGEALSKLLQGGGFNQLGLNNQFSQIGAQAQADLNMLNEGAAQKGFGNFGGTQAINAARLGTAASQKSDALAREQEMSHQRTLQNLGFLQNSLFGGAMDAGGMALQSQNAAKDRASAEKAALIGAAGAAIGGFCWIARAVFGADNPKWTDAKTWITESSPDWFFDRYVEYGPSAAKLIEKNCLLRWALRPIFEVIAWLGRR